MATNTPIRSRGSFLLDAGKGIAVAAVLTAAPLGLAAAPLGFEQALALAEQHSPVLEARRATVSGATAEFAAAGQLPDPRLAAGLENLPVSGADRFRWNAEPMTMRRISLMQDVPNRDKRQAQREAAQARIEGGRAALSSELLAVRSGAAVAWIDLHYAERRLELFKEVERENQLLRDTIESRVASGAALPADALMARQEALELAEQRDELQAAAAGASASLARWTGTPAQATAAPVPEFGVDPATLVDRLERHAQLLGFDPMLASARADVQEAQADKRGDWGWEVAYSNRARAFGDMVSFQLRFDLPLWQASRQDPRLAARRQELARVQAEREDSLRRVRAELLSQLAQLQRLERALERQRTGVLPLAVERVRLTLAGYEAGRAGLDTVLAARRDAVRARLKAVDLEAARTRLRAQLSYLIAE